MGRGGEEPSETSKDKQLAKGTRLQEACETATDTNNSELGQSWLDAGTSDPLAESGLLSARQYLDTGCLHTGGLRLWGEAGREKRKGRKNQKRVTPNTAHRHTHACVCAHTLSHTYI